MSDTTTQAEPDAAALPAVVQPMHTLGMEDDPKLADALIDRLNALLEYDDAVRRDLASLFLLRQQVFTVTANHPTLQIGQENDCMPATLGVLGLLNGLCGTIKPVAAARAEDAELVDRALATEDAGLVERALTTFPDSKVKSVSDEHGLTHSDELEGYGYISAVWEEGQLVRFERTKLAARTPATIPPAIVAGVVTCNITVNGEKYSIASGFESMNYRDVVGLAYPAERKTKVGSGVVYTVTFRNALPTADGSGADGTLLPNESLTVQNGTTINVSDTSGA